MDFGPPLYGYAKYFEQGSCQALGLQVDVLVFLYGFIKSTETAVDLLLYLLYVQNTVGTQIL